MCDCLLEQSVLQSSGRNKQTSSSVSSPDALLASLASLASLTSLASLASWSDGSSDSARVSIVSFLGSSWSEFGDSDCGKRYLLSYLGLIKLEKVNGTSGCF